MKTTIIKAIIALSTIAFAAGAAEAQQPAPTSETDSGTSAAIAKGSHPLGSYSASGFDSVNLFNGGTNMTFPLASLDGRGGLGASVTMSYNSKFWRTEDYGPDPGQGLEHQYAATYADWDAGPSLAPGWRVHFGYMKIRQYGWEEDTGPGDCHFFRKTMTKVTFVAPDGTEYDFRDDLYDGAFGTMGGCGQPGLNRGTTFHTADGSSATFVSDLPISDQQGAGAVAANGVVYLRDGTRFRVTDGFVIWRQDRNGNRVNFEYQGGQPTKIIDTFGREIVIQYFMSSPTEDRLFTVTYPGYNGTTHTITVRSKKLTEALHPDFWNGGTPQTPTYQELWGVFGVLNLGTFNPRVVTSIELPTGHAWTFDYNRYGEVAKANLPSGGAIRYEMTPGEGTIPPAFAPALFRYCAKRSTFVNSSDAIEEGSTRYSDPSSNNGAVVSTLDVFEDRYDHATRISRTKHTYSGGPLNSYFGYQTTELEHTGYSPWLEGRELETFEKGYPNGVETDRSKVKITWEQRPLRSGEAFPWGTVASPNVPSHDTRVKVQQSQLREVASPYPTSEVTYVYDDVAGFNNVKTERTYDFGPGSRGPLLRQVDRVYETSQLYTSVGPHLRSLVKSESVGDGSTVESTTVTEYDVYDSSPHHAPLLDRTFAPAVASSRGPNFGTGYTTRGNPTKVTAAANDIQANQPRTYFQYDIAGNAVVAYSPRVDEPGAIEDRHKLEVTFDPAFHFAYPTSTLRRVSRADNAGFTTLTTQTWYDFSTGLVKQVTGYNGEVTTLDYEPSANGLDRLLTVTRPGGAGAGGHGTTTYSYSAPGGNQWVQEDSDVTASTSVLKKTTYDGLMRPFYNESTNPNGSGLVSVTTRYDGLGRAIKSSNPLASAGASTDGWTVTVYDDQDRPLTVTTHDGRNEPPGTPVTGVVTSTYQGQVTTVTDQAGVSRRSTTDALGRAKIVVEDPTGVAYSTTYTYDARSNLTVVTQGAQTRRFEYDKVGRLWKATMPECGTTSAGAFTSYQFDLASNVTKVTDPRSVETRSGYDEMNRLRWVQYSNTTNTNDPLKDVSYFYDNSAPSSSEISNAGTLIPAGFNRGAALGRLVGVATNADVLTAQERTGVFYSYEQAGRLTSTTQLTDGLPYTSTVPSYNLASEPTQLGYPSGSTVGLAYNAAGALSSVSRNGATLSSSIQYAPVGALTQQTLGNGLVHSVVYNSRIQPLTIGLGASAGNPDKLKLEYDYGVWTSSATQPGSGPLPNQDKNNGNVGRIKITPGSGPNVITQCYGYDKLNRLLIAREFGETSGGGTVPPDPPTNLVATAVSSSQINLTWTDTTGETSYIVERRTENSGFAAVVTLAANIQSWSNTGLVGGTPYTYRVRASNAGGSSVSNEASATTLVGTVAGVPTLLSAIPSSQIVTLSWTAVSGQPPPTYKVFFATTPTGPYTQFGAALGGTTRSVNGLTNLTTYYFYVQAVVNGVDSYPSNTLSATPANIPPPTAPTILTASAHSSTQANIAWYDNSSDETGFEVWRSSNIVNYSRVGTTPADARYFEDSNLTPGTTYTYYIRAIKNGIPSDASKPVATVTTYLNGTRPSSPGDVAAAAISQSRLKLTWTDVGNETGYVVFRRSDRFPLFLLGTTSADVTQFVDNQVQPDSEYTYMVCAVNASSVLSLPTYASATTFGAGEDIPGSDTIGIFWPETSTWFLRNTNTYGVGDINFSYGQVPAFVPLKGDWDGDGDDTAGLYDPATSTFYLKNSNGVGAADITVSYGASGQGYVPVAGDWDGNGIDTIGLYHPSTGAFLLRNTNAGGTADITFYFGAGGAGFVPLAGDWDGNGTDTVGLYLGSSGVFFLRNANEAGEANLSFYFGAASSTPIVGDWDGDGADSIGTYVPAAAAFFLRNQNSGGLADVSLNFGPGGAIPLAGDWDDSALKTAPGDDASGDGASDDDGRTGRRGRRGRNGADKTAVAGVGWTEQYAYDRYGNRTDGPGMVSEKNQFVRTASGPGYDYDLAGNLTKSPDGTAFDTYSYDARNMLFQAVVNNGTTTTTAKFVYDGAGRRVKKIVTGGATTRFVYGAGGGLIAEYVNGTLSKEYVGGPTGMLAVVDVPAAKVNYLTPDHLGTPRIVTSNTGATATVVSRHDYRPFGAEIFVNTTGRTPAMGYAATPVLAQQSDSVRQQFTGYERDTETLLDFAQARYYGGNQGRFTTMDPLMASGQPGDPQSWNRYTYGLNNPVRYTDPTGMYSGDASLTYPHGEMVLAVDDSGTNLNSGKIAQAGGGASSDVKAANGVILAVKAEDGTLTVYVGGINNWSQKKSAGSRDAAVALLGSDGAVSISNDHTFVQAIVGKSNSESAQAFADVIQSAVASGIDPGKISVVAHSNGVPTLAAGLKLLSAAGFTDKMNSAALIAPNTRSVTKVTEIASRFDVTELAQSTRDLALFAAPFGSRSVGSWAKKLEGTGIGVVATRQFNHSFKAYATQLARNKFQVLLHRK